MASRSEINEPCRSVIIIFSGAIRLWQVEQLPGTEGEAGEPVRDKEEATQLFVNCLALPLTTHGPFLEGSNQRALSQSCA